MIKKQHGVVLVTVLLFLFIFTLLALAGLSNSQLQLRMNNNYVLQEQILQFVEAGLIKGEHDLASDSAVSCISTAKDKHSQIQPWTVGKGCVLSYSTETVHYLIQLENADNCLLMGIGQHHQAIFKEGDIYRITAWIVQFGYPVSILQSTYAKAKEESCVNPTMIIKPGRLSWRTLN